jgi:hypothetical protein
MAGLLAQCAEGRKAAALRDRGALGGIGGILTQRPHVDQGLQASRRAEYAAGVELLHEQKRHTQTDATDLVLQRQRIGTGADAAALDRVEHH